MGFSFVRAAVACAILERTSGLEPSSETTAPRYLMLVTVPIFCPVTFITLLMPLVLFVISLVFSALIPILYLVQVLSRLSTRASSFSCSSVRAIYIIGKPQIGYISRASDMVRWRKMLKRVGDRSQPCLIPTVVLNHSQIAAIRLTCTCSLVIQLLSGAN